MSLPPAILRMFEVMDNLTDIRIRGVIAYSRGRDEFDRFVTELDAKLESNARLIAATIHLFYENYRDQITVNGVTHSTMNAFWVSYDYRAKRLREHVAAIAGLASVSRSKRPADASVDTPTDKIPRLTPPLHPAT